jgi:hypothetical protein
VTRRSINRNDASEIKVGGARSSDEDFDDDGEPRRIDDKSFVSNA